MAAFSGKGYVGNWTPEGLIGATEAALARAAAKGALLVEREAKELVSKPGPTREFSTGESVGGETVRASLPGEPPRKRTGENLRNTIGTEKGNKSGTIWRVGTRGESRIGFWLEFGTRFMKPRPWLRPALKQNRQRLKRIFIEEAKKGKND